MHRFLNSDYVQIESNRMVQMFDFFVKLVVVDRILDWKIIENTVNHGRNIWNTLHFIKRIRDHSFSTYAKFSEKLTFLTP